MTFFTAVIFAYRDKLECLPLTFLILNNDTIVCTIKDVYRSYQCRWLSPSSTVVEVSTHNPKMEGSKPATVAGKEENSKNVINYLASGLSTGVEKKLQHTKVHGSSPGAPTTGTGR